MSNPIKEHMLTFLTKELRQDGRKLDEYRPIEIEYSISPKSAEGSARVKIGKTEVVAGIKVEIGEPFPDKPDEGTIMVNAELLPLSSPEFESGPPGINAIEISRVVDRGIREGKAINFKKLCIKAGEKIWIILIDIYPLNDAGNLFDAASLAALAALKNARFPKVEDDQVQYGEPTEKALPMEHMPISCTVLKIGNTFLVDPTNEEEEFCDARLTVAILENGNICALQKGGDEGISIEDSDTMVKLAIKKTKELRKVLEK